MPAFYITPSQFWQGNDGQWSTHTLQIGENPPTAINVLVSTAQPLIYGLLDESYLACNATGVSSDCITDRGGGIDPTVAPFQSLTNNTSTGYYLVDIEQNQPLPAIQDTQAVFGYDRIGLGYQGGNLPSLPHQLLSLFYTPALWLGLFGILPYTFTIGNTNKTIPSYLQTLKSQSTIESLSWGYQAGARYRENGVFASLIFGGYDANRFQASSVTFPMNPDHTRYLTVGLKSLDIILPTGSTSTLTSPINVTLDSTLPYFWLPPDVCKVFEDTFNLNYDSTANMYFVPSTSYDTMSTEAPALRFELSPDTSKSGDSVTIELQWAAFNLTASPPLADNKIYFPLKQSNDSGSWQLGRTFFQEIYLIADFERQNFSVNQATWDLSLPQNIQSILSSSGEPTPTPVSGGGSGGGGGSNTGAIAGGVVGGILGLALIAGLIWFFLRKRNRSAAGAHELSADEQAAAGIAPPSYRHDDVPMAQRSEMEAKSKLPGELAAGMANGRHTPVYSETTPLNGASANEMDANVYYELPTQQAIPDRFNDRDLSPHAAAIAAANTETTAPSTVGAPTVSDPTEAPDATSPHDTAFPLSTPGSERTGEILSPSDVVSPVSGTPKPAGSLHE